MYKRCGKDTLDFQFFQDYWKLYQDFFEADCGNLNENNAFWQEFTNASNELMAKYKDTEIYEFVKRMIMLRMTYVDMKDAPKRMSFISKTTDKLNEDLSEIDVSSNVREIINK